MPVWLVWIVTGIYTGVSIWFAFLKSPGWLLTYLGYSIANIGTIIVLTKGS